MDRQEILDRNPLIPYLEKMGVTLRGSGDKLQTNRCGFAEHKKGHFCVTVTASQGLWNCHDCQEGGSVIDWEMAAYGVDAKEAMRRLGGDPVETVSVKPMSSPSTRKEQGPSKLVKTYDYTDEDGTVLYQACRYEPKSFRQRRVVKSGEYAWDMQGVRLVPYNLPKIAAADLVWIAEGEKDADLLNRVGFVATTNVAGALNWTEAYTPYFRGKDLVILPDNDKAGEDRLQLLQKLLAKAAKSIRIVRMPEGFKDISDFVASFTTENAGVSAVMDILESVEVLYRGTAVPVQSMAEMEQDYIEYIKRSKTCRLQLGSWLPGLRGIRPLVPGEMVSILAGTGCGKTMILQNLALNTTLDTLMFEVELPNTLSFERFVAMSTKNSGGHVESMYDSGQNIRWGATGKLDHIQCCHESSLTTTRIKEIIESAELKTNRRPRLVLIDYIQLVQAAGAGKGSRYDRISDVAEHLKVIAKQTETIIVIASQVGRAAKGKNDTGKLQTQEVSLTDGKESGSIENSSGLVLGAWRDAEDKQRLWIRVLKATKGGAGKTIPCRIHDSLLIHEEEAKQ